MLLLFTLLPSFAHGKDLGGKGAKNKTFKIAVMDLKALGVEKDLAANLSNLVGAKVRTMDVGSVLTGADIVAMLEFTRTQSQMGCDKLSCMAELGGALGVDVLIAGSVGKIGRSYMLTLQMVDTDRANVVSGVQTRLQGTVDEFIPVVEDAVEELFRKATGPMGQVFRERGKSVRMTDAYVPKYWVGFLAPGASTASKYNLSGFGGEAVNLELGLAGKTTMLVVDAMVGGQTSAGGGEKTLTVTTPGLVGVGVRRTFTWVSLHASVDGGYVLVNAKNTAGDQAQTNAGVVAPGVGLDWRFGRSFTMGLLGRYRILMFKETSLGLADVTLRWGWGWGS